MRTIVFEIRGQYGHFRKPYAPASPVTYPFPPPPTIIGIMGAICGYGKDEYAERVGWDRVRVAIEMLSPVKRFRVGLNLINTKGNRYFRLVGDTPRTPIPYEFLKDPAYRVYVANANEEAMERLVGLLKIDKTIYTPSLGLAQCLATVSFCQETVASNEPDGCVDVCSVIPMDQVREIHYENGRRYARFRVPERMRSDRTVERYSEVVVDEGYEKVNGDMGKIRVQTDQAYKVMNNHVLFF